MEMKGKDAVKLLDVMRAVTIKQNNYDHESYYDITQLDLDISYIYGNSRPEELQEIDINLIAHTVFAALKDYSNDATKLEIIVKIINVLNADFNDTESYLDLLLGSLIYNDTDTTKAFAIVNDLSECLQRFVLANITKAKNLLITVDTHKLYLDIQQWERMNIPPESINVLFEKCDELLFLTPPHEFKKMLAHKGFPAVFLLEYFDNNYRRELKIMQLSHKILVKKWVESVSILIDLRLNPYSQFIKHIPVILNKIGIAFETVDHNEWDLNDIRTILGPLIIKLIRYSNASIYEDNTYIHNTIVNLIKLLGDTHIIEQGLYEAIFSNQRWRLIESKNFMLLANKFTNFPEQDRLEFFKKYDLFPFNNTKKLNVNDARLNIKNVTKFIEAMEYFKVPFNTIIETKINDLTAPAIVGALLTNSKVCELAKKSDDNNVFEYLKLHPEICVCLNANIDDVMVMLTNINPYNDLEDSSDFFATSYDILKICKFDNNESPAYLLFALRILVEKVFSTQIIPGHIMALFYIDATLAVQEQVKQQLKDAVFAMIEKGVNIEAIKEYLRSKDSGLNQIYFRSFVHNFLSEIQEREIRHQEPNLQKSLLPAYKRLNIEPEIIESANNNNKTKAPCTNSL